jgi:hypothetical protein
MKKERGHLSDLAALLPPEISVPSPADVAEYHERQEKLRVGKGAEDRFWKEQARRAQAGGDGATTGGGILINECLARLSDYIAAEVEVRSGAKAGWERELRRILRELKEGSHADGYTYRSASGLTVKEKTEPQNRNPADRVAALTLWAAIGAVANTDYNDDNAARAIEECLGRVLEEELDHAGLLKQRPGTAKALKHERDAAYFDRSLNIDERRDLFIDYGTKAGFIWADWSRDDRVRAGHWLSVACQKALPDFFTIRTRRCVLAIREDAYDRVLELAKAVMRPIHLPPLTPPKPHKGNSLHASGINSLQAEPLSINFPVFALLGQCTGLLKVTGKTKYQMLTRYRQNCLRIGMDANIAWGLGTFYSPLKPDWRGRVYGVPHFNYQREDHVRALIMFAKGKPIGDHGIRALKIHLANCYGLDKKRFEERLAWVDANLAKLQALALDPMADLWWWEEADKPFLLYAAAFELTAALATPDPTAYVTHLPIPVDGSCSALQHAAALTRSKTEGALVNLVPSDDPQDIYLAVAKRTEGLLEAARGDEQLWRSVTVADLAAGEVISQTQSQTVGALAETCLRWGIDRKLLKPPVMTFNYSATTSGMRKQIYANVRERIDPATKQPFAFDLEALNYLVARVRDVIAELAPGATAVMDFLRACQNILGEYGIPLSWTSPSGFKVVNDYRDVRERTLELRTSGKRVERKLVHGTDKFSKARAANAVTPNFTHSQDAAHLMLVANVCAAEGISLLTVHDSFGTHACDVPRLKQILAEQLALIYEHDPLRQILETVVKIKPAYRTGRKQVVMRDTRARLEELLPTPGDLDLKNISDYAFS